MLGAGLSPSEVGVVEASLQSELPAWYPYHAYVAEPEVGNMLGVCGLAVGPWMQESGDSAFNLFVVSRLLDCIPATRSSLDCN